jgi:hypothetical protein
VAVAAANAGVAGQSMVVGAGRAAITGAVTSWTVMAWLTVPLSLPQASLAFQVFVRTYDPGQEPATVTSLTSDTTGAASQASVAVGAVKTGVFGQLIVALTPGALIVGAVVSCTWIVWLAVELLLQASLAVQVRVMS